MAVASRRLGKELQDIMKNGMPTGITLLKADNFEEWFIQIEVLGESLYVDEKFCIRFVFESQYPIASPQVTFVTTDGWKAPLHPHVYTNGHCCLSILGPEWSPVLTVSSVCLSLQSMLASSKEKASPQDNDRYVRSAPLNPKKTRWHYDDDTV